MGLRVLCVGDMHLGRRPRRLPEGLIEHGVEVRTLAPTAAWHATVEAAIEKRVDIVLLAGDVVESLEDRFEAYGHLERGVKRLVESGICVLGVTGNHDVEALPRLAKQIPDFRLLGQRGQWEWFDFERGDQRVRIVGWSFPKKHYSQDPLESFPTLPDDGVCTLGLLHCDLDAHRSDYAPVRRVDLERTSCDAWFLGHIHVPSKLVTPRPIGYLGSLAGLDPGEHGARGPWHFETHGKGRVEVLEQLSVSPLRWEREIVRCDEWDREEPEALESRLEAAVHSALERAHERLRVVDGKTRVVGVRLIFCGRTKWRSELRRLLQRMPIGELVRLQDEILYFPEKLVDELSPAIDLQELAQQADPPGLLARTLLTLQAGGAESETLCGRLERELEAVDQKASYWSGLDEPQFDVRERAQRCAWRALEELLEQHTKTVAP